MPAAAIAVPENGTFNRGWFTDLSPKQMLDVIEDQFGKLVDYRTAYGEDAGALTRAGDAIVDSVITVSAGFAVPLFLSAFPKLQRIGRGAFFVDTQALVGVGALVGGGILYAMGIEGGKALFQAGQGIAASYAGIVATKVGGTWFAPTN